MFVKDSSYTEITSLNNIISLNKKVKLEIGLKNNVKDDNKDTISGYYYNNKFYKDSEHTIKLAEKINQYYKDILTKKIYYYNGQSFIMCNNYEDYPIIWYPQGIFVTISANLTHGTNGTTMQASFKDKMCLLNGEMGGIIQASTQLDQYDTIDDTGKWITKKVPLCQIISELVVHLGGESIDKVFVEDLDPRVKMVMKWSGNKPIYIGEKNNSYIITTNYTDITRGGYVGKTYQYGDDIGFIYTDFVYTEDLIADAGSSVCAQLDKIKNYLGNYEYFYDIYGNFHFQEIKNYLNNSQAKVDVDALSPDDYRIDLSQGKAVYTFDNGVLITSFQNNPQYQNIKNDFIVWGIKKNSSGNDIPIRYHLAIDKKPPIEGYGQHEDNPNAPYYGEHNLCIYEDQDDGLTKAVKPMYFSTLKQLNSITGIEGTFYYVEQKNKIYIWKNGKFEIAEGLNLETVYSWDWRTELYFQGIEAGPTATYTNSYYVELANEWPKIYDIKNGKFYSDTIDKPEDIEYFLDFIDIGAAINEFNIENIGRRSQIVNDNNINCIFEPEVPPFILIEKEQPDTDEKRDEAIAQGQKFLQVSPQIYSLLNIGGNLNSAYVKVRELLYQYTNYNEGITIQTIPLFYLEPNTRIAVRDVESDIYGDYMISTISIPLAINGTTSISATRALERF